MNGVSNELRVRENQMTVSRETTKGRLNAYDVSKVVPESHAENWVKIALIATAIVGVIFITSIILWAVGASTDIAGLVIVGKIFFSLTLVTILPLVGMLCVGTGGAICVGLCSK